MHTIIYFILPGALTLLGAHAVWSHLNRTAPGATDPTAFPNDQERVVIIGASSGIGRCLALRCAKGGATVMIVARRGDLLNALVEECKVEAPTATVIPIIGDMSKQADMLALRDAVVSHFPSGPTTLLFNAGVMSGRAFTALEPSSVFETVEGIFRINAESPILLTSLLLPHVPDHARIMVMSSAAGLVGAPTRTLYAATKHALHGFFSSLRIELLPRDISVTIVCPGGVRTGLRASAIDHVPGSEDGPLPSGLEPDWVAKEALLATARRERMPIFPRTYSLIPLLLPIIPGFLDRMAVKKYAKNPNA